MAARDPAPLPATGVPVLVYDGDCGFCTASASWLARRWTVAARAVPWQQLDPAALADLGLTAGAAAEAAWWVDERGVAWRGHLAIARALAAAGGAWGPAGRAIGVPPLRWVAAAAYPVVVAVRHHLPGATPACRATASGTPAPVAGRPPAPQ